MDTPYPKTMIQIKTAAYLALTVFMIISFPCTALANETFCLEKTCFTKPLNSEKESKIKAKLEGLIKNIDKNLDDYVYYSDEIKEKWTTDLDTTFRKYYSWIKLSDLQYIVLGDQYSAVLLKKDPDHRYALFYNHSIDEFEISYDPPKEYEDIVKLWINGKTVPTIK